MAASVTAMDLCLLFFGAAADSSLASLRRAVRVGRRLRLTSSSTSANTLDASDIFLAQVVVTGNQKLQKMACVARICEKP